MAIAMLYVLICVGYNLAYINRYAAAFGVFLIPQLEKSKIILEEDHRPKPLCGR